MHALTQDLYTCTCAHTHTPHTNAHTPHTNAHTHQRTHTHQHTHTHTHMHTRMHTRMHTHTHAHTHAHTHVRAYTHAHMYTHTYRTSFRRCSVLGVPWECRWMSHALALSLQSDRTDAILRTIGQNLTSSTQMVGLHLSVNFGALLCVCYF